MFRQLSTFIGNRTLSGAKRERVKEREGEAPRSPLPYPINDFLDYLVCEALRRDRKDRAYIEENRSVVIVERSSQVC